MSPEPQIAVANREQLLYLLAEAAEIEHGLMCCYLFALFSLKRSTDEGVSQDEMTAIDRWRRSLTSIAVEEMAHLALVSNISCALGGSPHFSRPNFPVSAGMHPSGVVLKLAPFDRDTLQHFVFLERPEGTDVPDGRSFDGISDYVRETVIDKCMPSAQDYATVGHLYRAIAAGFADLAATNGEADVMIGDPDGQIGPEITQLPGLRRVVTVQDGIDAVTTILEQGEGTASDTPTAHYRRLVAIAEEYDAILARKPDFVPARSVVRNPVMRRPPDVTGKVFIGAPQAAAVLDFANALYGQMLRCLAQAFGRPGAAGEKQMLIDAAIDLMFAFRPVAELLTQLPATLEAPDRKAGMSFAMLRDVSRLPHGPSEWKFLRDRFAELLATAVRLVAEGQPLAEPAKTLQTILDKFSHRAETHKHEDAKVKQPEIASPTGTAQRQDADVEVADGETVSIRFEAKRCIHARFCVLGLPDVYRANVKGAWLNPDAASVEENVSVARNCPSGAIQYVRRDGGLAEPAPRVNLIAVRENGPLAVRAEILMDGRTIGFRATLCRCGASTNKPFCDGSHVAAGFHASGEPMSGASDSLAVRNGPLAIRPQKNGPLALSGNVEITSGTGRTIFKATQAVLCRCGQSANKPFCDGSHHRVGFRS